VITHGPLGAAPLVGVRDRPPVGRLVFYADAVWAVTAVEALDLDDDDRDRWLAEGMPDPGTWWAAPYRVDVKHIGGRRPHDDDDGEPVDEGSISVHTRHIHSPDFRWWVYPESGRWPRCSCCGDPMPCRADREDRYVDAQLAELRRLESVMPGCCWGCREPITRRQHSVVYPGDNLDLPGGPEVAFHTRRGCGWRADQYELRWLAADPSRDRILTWPKCAGRLVVHGDGTSECFGGDVDCRGHETHDHADATACYEQTHGCPKDCARDGHPGTWRPRRRRRTTPGGAR
jgi:hypothetical protein